MRSLEGDDLVQNLRQLVINCDSHIREAGSIENVEETLLHLEENDDKFHRSVLCVYYMYASCVHVMFLYLFSFPIMHARQVFVFYNRQNFTYILLVQSYKVV